MPICTKEHYKFIIKVIRTMPVTTYINQDILIEQLIEAFKIDNPLFDKDKFLKELRGDEDNEDS